MNREWKEFKWEDIPNDFFTGKYEVECQLLHSISCIGFYRREDNEWVSFTNLDDIITQSKKGTQFRYRSKFIPQKEEIKIIVGKEETSTRVELFLNEDVCYIEHRVIHDSSNSNSVFLGRVRQILDVVTSRANEI